MSLMSEVRNLYKRAGISDEIVAHKILGITRATIYRWEESGVPDNRVKQLTALKETLQYYINEGTLPIEKSELVWQGILHVTECFDLEKK